MSFSDLARDPRVDRQIRFLTGTHEVVTAGFAPPSDPSLEFHNMAAPDETLQGWAWRRTRSLPGMAFRRYKLIHSDRPLHKGALKAVQNTRPDIVLVNDVAGLAAAFAAARGAPVVLDSHEHAPSEYSERRTWRWVRGPYVHWLCKTYLPQLAAMTSVSQGIADAYAQEYGIKVDVLTNAPFRMELEPRPVSSPLKLIHHGIGAPRRQLELLIEAAAPLADRVTLDLMLAAGDPVYIEELTRRAEATTNVRVIPPVNYLDIIETVNHYDVGVHLIPLIGLHDYYALPNKIFEYVQGRVALAISPSPDMQRIVEEHGCGVVATHATAESFSEALATLDPDNVWDFKQASHRAADILCAENNREQLLAILDAALAKSRDTQTAGARAS